MGYGPYLKFDFSKYENLVKFHKLIASRPSFLQAVEANALALQRMKLPVFTAGSK
jgi:uncharacterized protein YfkK (UPF0435 family)